MKYYCLPILLLAACQPVADETVIPAETDDLKVAETVVQEDVVALRLNDPVSEARACIIPISIENGLHTETNVTMIGFDLTGPGDDAKGNMFAPAAAPGEISEARVIIQGQNCDAFDTISIPEIRCTSGEESCEGQVKLIDGGGLRFSQTG